MAYGKQPLSICDKPYANLLNRKSPRDLFRIASRLHHFFQRVEESFRIARLDDVAPEDNAARAGAHLIRGKAERVDLARRFARAESKKDRKSVV